MTTQSSPGRRVDFTWAALMFATALSTWGLPWELSRSYVAPAIFALVGGKLLLIMLEFMELRRAPRLARLPFLAWSLTLPAAVVALDLISR